jgi:hypothetical protein
MKSGFARDLADQNGPIEQAVATSPGKPIRLRIQPMVLIAGQYRAWKDVRWTLECETADEAFETREAMVAFFSALADHGPQAVAQLLASTKEGAPKAGAA